VEGEVAISGATTGAVPRVQDLAELNALLLQGCQQDQQRSIAGKTMKVGEAMEVDANICCRWRGKASSWRRLASESG